MEQKADKKPYIEMILFLVLFSFFMIGILLFIEKYELDIKGVPYYAFGSFCLIYGLLTIKNDRFIGIGQKLFSVYPVDIKKARTFGVLLSILGAIICFLGYLSLY